MMKYISLLLLLCGNVAQTMYAQNLVPNGGFEEVIECPETTDALHFGCANWYKSIQISGNEMHENPSPDWYHGCSDNPVFVPPNVVFSYQSPFEGNGMAGLIMFASNHENYREVIGVELNQSLEIGETYLVEFQLSWGYFNVGSLKTNNQGVRFSNHPIFESAEEVVNNFAHFQIDTLITDSVSWLGVSFLFNADSAYDYLHIGNFYSDEFTLMENSDGDYNLWAYYFVDNVSVQKSMSVDRSDLDFGLEVFPNPVSSFLTLSIRSNIEKYEIFELTGKKMQSIRTKATNKIKIDISQFSQGTYLLQVIDDKGNRYSKKIVKI